MSIKVPLPGMELGHVNIYILKCDDGYGLIDVGLATYEAALALLRGLKSMGIKPGQITKVYVTHFHVDHITLAQLLSEVASPEFHIGSEELKTPFDEFVKLLLDEYKQLGVPTEIIEGFQKFHPVARFRKAYEDVWRIQWRGVTDGEELDCGIRAMWTPGHTPGHMVYLSQAGVYTGDHILPKITPNISWIPRDGFNPLGEYLKSLRKTHMETVAYPAHGDPIVDLPKRVEELLEHHQRRLGELLHLLSRPMSLYEVAKNLTWSLGKFEQFDIYNKLFAIGEAYSHILYLESTGQIRRIESEPPRWVSL